MVGVGWWQASLEGLGSILAFFYQVVPNYGVDIILLTLLVRVVLLPLTIRQVRSMRTSQAAMRRVQPKIEALKKKYKGNRQRFNEEMMKVYKEEGVNPAAGCLPVLFIVLQAPVFIALFSVLRGDPNKVEDRFPTREGVNPAVAHLPDGSSLAQAIQEQRANFLSMNLTCAPSQAGRGQVDLVPGPEVARVDCGSGILAAVPFYVLLALIVVTTWYQTKQIQTTSTGAQTQQMQQTQQMMGRIMPLFLGVFSYSIPAGVVMYWVTTNAWQIGQQQLMLPQKPQDEVESRPAPKSSGGRPKGGRGSRNAGSRKKRPKR